MELVFLLHLTFHMNLANSVHTIPTQFQFSIPLGLINPLRCAEGVAFFIRLAEWVLFRMEIGVIRFNSAIRKTALLLMKLGQSFLKILIACCHPQ